MSPRVPTGLLKSHNRIGAILADLSAEDAALVILDHVELMGLAATSAWSRYADRKRKHAGIRPERDRIEGGIRPERDRIEGGIRPENHRNAGAESDRKTTGTEVVGGRGGSLISDLQSGSSLQSPTLSFLGSPTPVTGSTAENGGAETSEGGPALAGERAQHEPALSSRAEAPTGPGATSELQAHSSPAEAPKSRASLTFEGSDTESSGLHKASFRACGTRGVRGARPPSVQPAETAAAEQGRTLDRKGTGEAQSAVPDAPRRFNPSALVEHFVAGVNEAGGYWTCGSGKPFTDLAAALQLHVAHGVGVTRVCVQLGARWYAYCGGAPRKAWDAAAWLGEGAPERPRAPGEATPIDAAKERAARIRRTREAISREEAYEREKAQRGPPPLEIQAQMAALWSPPAPPPASGKQRAWTPELDDQVKELASGGDE